MSVSQLAGRAAGLRQAAGFVSTLLRYMGELEVETAGEALEHLQAAISYRPGESFSSA
jgi:hypothetical protein